MNDLENHMVLSSYHFADSSRRHDREQRVIDQIEHAQAVTDTMNAYGETDPDLVVDSLLEAFDIGNADHAKDVNAAIMQEDEAELGRLLLQGARAYLKAFAIKEINDK